MIPALTLPPSYSLYQPPAIEETGTEDAVLPSIAVSLSEQSSVVASLGGNNSAAQVIPRPACSTRSCRPVRYRNPWRCRRSAVRPRASPVAAGPTGRRQPGREHVQFRPLHGRWPAAKCASRAVVLLGDVLKTRPNLAGVAASSLFNSSVLGAFEAYA